MANEQFSNYQEFLRSQKDSFLETLNKTAIAPDEKLKFGPSGVFNEFVTALSFQLGASADERRDQLIKWGVSPKYVIAMSCDGSQDNTAFRALEVLGSHDPNAVRELASALVKVVEAY